MSIETIDEKDIITIQKSEWDMILSGEKWVLFLEMNKEANR